ncbi:Uncharacterised protein [Mycolicibacterium phlei]|uniref:hypothetical protein n=1 Tax=Mycobacteroides chelonae TaxID=1774 RepID=UPI000618BDDB|nr:hypothetical protein [Mycobacteroides chelonae]VEG16005.1 Uncharacterised protein [Mycolicibacterium phlei]AKC38650.1 hypothetical protein GR01_08820 [Mycobacteroides chelonae]ANB00889.1 hypothetical protein BB28_09325 [Mycobacteroides chelonae CCUG 47445]OLT78139.1 hypothetical protein BKG56_14300 [Mycobacteroides chelonae]ORV15083.1 hypothetical protein AWB96_11265 [Mycobacteroides chelonae]
MDGQPLGEYPPLPPYGLINATVAATFDAFAALLPGASAVEPPKFSIRDNLGVIQPVDPEPKAPFSRHHRRRIHHRRR